MNPNVQEKITKLQLLEQNISSFSTQKQQLQAQLMEVDSASNELASSDEAFKIVGNIMVKSDVSDLKIDLSSRKETLTLRVSSLEKQEDKLKAEAEELQASIMKEMNDGSNDK